MDQGHVLRLWLWQSYGEGLLHAVSMELQNLWIMNLIKKLGDYTATTSEF